MRQFLQRVNRGGVQTSQRCVESSRYRLNGGGGEKPFGLVMIDVLDCGMSLITWRCGSVLQIIADGVTCFVVDSSDEAVEAVRACEVGARNRIQPPFPRAPCVP